jgi:hypothetical protein
VCSTAWLSTALAFTSDSACRMCTTALCWVDLRGPAQRLGPHSPLDRALIGGAQPLHGWWAPDALCYIKKGVGAAGSCDEVRCAPNPTPKTLGHPIGLRSGVGKLHCATSVLLLPSRRSVPVEARRTTGSTPPPR